MESLNNLPSNSDSNPRQTPDEVLSNMTRDLQQLQQRLVVELSQDVSRLQSEKSKLIHDIDALQSRHQDLNRHHEATLSEQQIAQQQIWAAQMAQAIADHLQSLLVHRLNQMTPDALTGTPARGGPPVDSQQDATYRVLNSLDASLNQTLASVKQDLSSYQSTLSQQLNRMQTMQQQGEAILEVLVSRLNQQLQDEVRRNQGVAQLSVTTPPWTSASLPDLRPEPAPLHRNGTSPPPPAAPLPTPAAPPMPPSQLGLIMVLGSTLALSVHNVVVGIIGNESSLFNVWSLGGFISLASLGNSILVLLIRMLIVVPLMAAIAMVIYPKTWTDIKAFCRSTDRKLMYTVVGSGGFLFLSQVLIYIAIAGVGPGVAVTILFMYPIITAPLAWIFFNDRPSWLRVVVMVGIFVGVVLTSWPRLVGTQEVSVWGIGTAIVSGIAFACYLISMQISFRKMHPVPVSVVQFFTIFVLTCLSLIVLPLLNPLIGFDYGLVLNPQGRGGLLVSGFILGALTLVGYLMNNFGVRYMGAARAAIVASSGPVLTALLAFIMTPGPRTALTTVQIIGVLVVTLGVTAMNFEKMLLQRSKS
jgi:drug/metabolite transporter (DMT)-like permease